MAETKFFAGPQIRAVREVKGVKQEWLADRLGVSQPALSKMEANETMVDKETLTQIAAALGVNVDDILAFDRANVFNNCNQSGTFAGTNNVFTFCGDSEKDKIIIEQAEKIKALEMQLKSKK